MSQEYTPVEWVDETPTQIGTVINKARLDQMQTAHHYADGFEEVDAVPTEDPEVDYHKVVYCTLDSTFYRWNGEEWTKDIDDDTKALLLAHEADHSNPHQVTKAQVGLGNCDNTSDADKPVSTAQQAALDAKVDKLSTKPTAGTYTKVTINGEGQVTAGNTLAATDIPSLDWSKITSGKPTTLAGYGITDAVPKLTTAPTAGDYTKVTINADGLVTAGANPTTLSGYGITDAYTKAETDTLLNGKINTKGSQTIEADNATMTLALKRNIDISTITTSTPISDVIFTAINGSNTDFMASRIQFRRYSNRSRIWASLYRISNSEESALMLEQFDSGRIAVLVFNTVNGVVTNHYLLDSTP